LDGQMAWDAIALLRRHLRRQVVVLPEHMRATGHTRAAKDGEEQGQPYSTRAHGTLTNV
jgi:hypothetical protein